MPVPQYFHAAQGSGDQGGGQRLVGDEVRRGQQDLSLGAGDGGEIQLAMAWRSLSGPDSTTCSHGPAASAKWGKIPVQRFLAGGEVPIFQEDELQTMDRFTFDAQVQVAPGVRSSLDMAMSVADVDATCKADPASQTTILRWVRKLT